MNKALVWLITLLFLIFSATPNRVLAHPPYISPKTRAREGVWDHKIMKVRKIGVGASNSGHSPGAGGIP
ncbi:hypothetical protein AtNW77_Chr1g0054961 [Arabidopsis thaliana]|uniref:Serine rich endogenous peptide 22 n=2 Tax=Arabidopsis thaliana TaxID=3702 RepID=SOP22_ARATH|nr:uncharacterized protein AT1G54957 [Arabidopsis thaliana]A0A1P8AVP6.1 RecName: Full=Serine rich endogenous peptide 22; Short=AtSCOOP22; AltName: Full=Phytocytokine SCOOP22; AltName: Full=Precursor of serine rich endogenous peptide phytocytokine 22; Flags: Precursor [Arabidopsis thaliana]ANM60728.1 transmembrane protein [Arabidopsis thaliana]CAA0295663.1 unnamed protein product [Arabidopsis thaliana]CAD5315584.1 unnamed protein product [Arabidopsis thaliana]VYS49138.1 unnamed protein product |eukprot:NP_001322992.1 transmembrane protein [Arabidopsis thaliana]